MVIDMFLQRDDSCIFATYNQLHSFIKKLLSKFLSVQHMKTVDNIKDVKYHERENQLQDKQLFIGIMIKQNVGKLLRDGDADLRKVAEFYEAVCQFYEVATEEAFAKLLLDD